MKIIKKLLVASLVILVLVSLLVGCRQNQPAATKEDPLKDYPNRPITVIVTFSAGGGTDIGVRLLMRYAEKHLGQSTAVVNIDGGGSEVGAVEIKNSKPDGYTIGNFNSATIMLTSVRQAMFDPLKDFEPICLMVLDPRLFAVRTGDDRFKTIEDFLAFAKANPGKIAIGTSGAGTTGHFSIEALNHFANIKVLPIHFGGAGESKAAFLGGHVDAITQTVGEVTGMVKDGQARVLAVLSDTRLEEWPDIPTFKELGIDLQMASARGFVAPAGTPREIIDFLANAFKKAMEEPGFIEEANKLGLPIKFLGPDEYREWNKNEKALYDEMVKLISK